MKNYFSDFDFGTPELQALGSQLRERLTVLPAPEPKRIAELLRAIDLKARRREEQAALGTRN